MADEIRRVAATAWVAAVTDTLADGWSHFDWLGVVDELGRSDELRVVVRLVDPATAGGVRLETAVPRMAPELDSVRTVLPGAAWHEREASDLFGVRFRGGDERPLLVAAHGEPGDLLEHPLRKEAVLASRAVLAWPGAAGDADTTRRRMAPPGVPDPDVFGARATTAGPLDAAALLAPSRRRR